MISYGTDVSDTLTCPGSQACVSTTLYQRQPSDGWSATMAWCEDPDNATELFRSLVETVLTLVPDDGLTTTADPDTTTTTVNDEIPTVTDTDTTFTTRPTSLGGEGNETGSPDPDIEDDGGSGTNVGAIAGGVVGGVAGLVLIVLAIWFVMRRQKKKNAELREIGGGYVAPEPK
ncbi:hypothetical protein BJY04DRAFT_192666 [Aspergillus karnatakaensis]|uniref:uncharacterized protein n=1 Tax=Aspergillus karnatakaensis TaxID=1810916 RepID=UPI003CCDAB04